MKKPQIIYVHGGESFDHTWEGFSSVVKKNLKNIFKSGAIRWPDNLNRELPSWSIVKLKMPGKYNAKYIDWKRHFESEINGFEKDVILLGWSLGANFLAKYLSESYYPGKIKALHLVAGCYGCAGGFGIHKKLQNISNKCENIHLYHSKDDFVVDFKDFEKYKKMLPKANLHIFKDRNHFLQSDFPELIESLKVISMKLK